MAPNRPEDFSQRRQERKANKEVFLVVLGVLARERFFTLRAIVADGRERID
jgi:hypothetical protein